MCWQQREPRLARSQAQALQRREDKTDALAHKLELVSPKAVLHRGYAIVRREDGEIVRNAGQVAPGEPLNVLLAEGELQVTVSSEGRRAEQSRP